MRVQKLTILAVLCLALTACNTNTVLVAMQLTLNSIAALAPALATAGVSPAVVKEVEEYASAAATGVGQCAALASQPGPQAQIILQCYQYLGIAVKPTLPAGTAQNIVDLVNNIAKQVVGVMAALQKPPLNSSARRVFSVEGRWNPSPRDIAEFHAVAQRAATLARSH